MTTTSRATQTTALGALLRTVVAISIGAAALAGCGSGGPTVDPANDPAPVERDPVTDDDGGVDDGEVMDGDEFDLAAFCAQAGPMLVPVEREYVGSEEHVQDFRDLRAVAPEDLDGTIARLIDHYELDVSPSDPDSQNFENFPADVQDAALLLGDEIEARC